MTMSHQIKNANKNTEISFFKMEILEIKSTITEGHTSMSELAEERILKIGQYTLCDSKDRQKKNEEKNNHSKRGASLKSWIHIN